MLKILHSQKKDINFYKIFSWEKIFIKSPYHKRKIDKKKQYPPPFSNHPIPHHQKTNSLEFFLNPTFLLWETTKLLLPMPPKKQTFGLDPIPKKIHLSQSLKKNPPFERGGITPSSPFHPKKNPFGKKNPNPLSPSLTYNL